VRETAADELAYDPSPQAASLLLVLLSRDVDPVVRGHAAEAIVERRDPALDIALQRSAVGDPDPGVRDIANAAHRRLWPLRKRPGTAAGLSLLCPGCGQLYLGQDTGALNLAAFTALVGSGYVLIRGHTLGSLDGPSDSAQVPLGLTLVEAAQNLWFYSIFDAYRSARILRADAGYSFAITRESLGELASAPFRLDVIKSPWVWAGVPLALAAGLGVSALANDFSSDRKSIFDVRRVNVLGHDFHRGTGYAAGLGYYASLFAPVGVGEESLFRGVIQTEFEERWGPTVGLFAASAVFGAAHILNFGNDPGAAAVAVPVIAILGSSLGLAYRRTGHKLSTSVAMHFWYDFLLSAVAFAADPENQPFVVNYGAPM
jgi:membrane protease YdiL (CAAX protease family)